MLVAAVVLLCAAMVTALLGARALARPTAQPVLRAVAPAQLAAAVMLAAGGLVAMSGQASIWLLVLCVAGALGTVAAGVWQGARYTAAAIERVTVDCRRTCEHACATCTLSRE